MHYDNLLRQVGCPVGRIFETISQVDGQVFTKVVCSQEAEMLSWHWCRLAAALTGITTSVIERSNFHWRLLMLWKRISELLARVETWIMAKPIRETGCRFAIGHRSFQVFCRCYPAEEGGLQNSTIHTLDCSRTLGVVGQQYLELSAVDSSPEP